MTRSDSCFTTIMVIYPTYSTSKWINLIGGSHPFQQFWLKHLDL
ncbi:hypothetical protein Gotur_028652 [Gossypium turneri]